MTAADEKDLEGIRTLLADVDSADCEIREKMYVRRGLYSKAIRLSKELTGRIGFTAEEMEKISSEFGRRGFASKKAKDAVMKTRALFFDDSRDDFRNVLCTRISSFGSFDFRVHYDELTFEFQHAPTGKCFALKYKAYDSPKDFDYDAACLMPRGECLSGFALVHPYCESCSGTIAYGFDLREFREKVLEYADRGFAPEKRERGEDEWIYYDESGRLMEELQYMKRLERAW